MNRIAVALLVFASVCIAQPEFEVKFEAGAVASLKHSGDSADTEYIQSGRRLGEVLLRYRQAGGEWFSAQPAALIGNGAASFSTNADGTEFKATCEITNGASAALLLESRFNIQDEALLWTMTLRNLADAPLEIGDLALPLPMNTPFSRNQSKILKHGLVSGHGSFLFWVRPERGAPLLMLMPVGDTHLEYWDTQGGFRGYRVFIHSMAAGAEAKERGTKWRQPHSRLMLAAKAQPGDAHSYAFKFRWVDPSSGVDPARQRPGIRPSAGAVQNLAADPFAPYDAVRQVLVDEGSIDIHVVPGMTVPNDLVARFAVRTKHEIKSVEAEFPGATQIESLGTRGDYRLYQVRFDRLGENRLTILYGNTRRAFLEFFSTEPLETLIKKRAAFLARSQHRDTNKWFNGLITDWNMATQKLLSPEDYAPIPRNRYYAVTCDDPGLGKPAFLAAKNADFPSQREVEALDYYIRHFVWGGLQCTDGEKYPYAIYGIPDWKTNRESAEPGRNGRLHLWRVYDYPHVVLMYFSMYRVAKNHPQIETALTAREYLQRAAGTALAMFTVPMEIERWSAYRTGFYNEVVLVDLIEELQAAGMTSEAERLGGHWERKVRSFVNERQDLFRSEYAFDTTGFESTHALANYAVRHVGESNSNVSGEAARRFMETQMAANLFCRGVLEPAYYLLGSDFRGSGGNGYTLTYMSQMGGWSVLDYALCFATNRAPFLRLGYASYLSAWALMNTGTRESGFGYWYPGAANDGGAGGGFEPAPSGQTWLGQPHHRGSWNFACEIDLGYCGALRSAATVLADDSIFGRFCFGGDWRQTRGRIEVVPRDGLRRRFHALLGENKLQLELENDRFAAAQPIVLKEDFSEVRFSVESDNRARHVAKLRVSGRAGEYEIRDGQTRTVTVTVREGEESVIQLSLDGGRKIFTLIRRAAKA